MSQKSLDTAVIENLKSLGGMELLAELHTVFISTSEKLVADILSAVATNDAQALQDKAHSLKSSSGNMGALELSQMCLKLEKMGQAKNLDGAKPLAQALEAEFKKASLELTAIVKGQ